MSSNKLIYDFSYTGAEQSIKLPSGLYMFEAWGAGGGLSELKYDPTNNSSCGGEGGYTKAIFYVRQNTTIYIYVGAKGGGPYYNSTGKWAFNGGAPCYATAADACDGGGATDFRLQGGPWDNLDGLKSRFLVAGGGGGCEDHYNYIALDGIGGDGGGLTAQDGYNAKAGSQTTGYALGKGEPGYPQQNNEAPGGGGGWYGGYSAYDASRNWNSGGGGGSSYIKGYNGCNTDYIQSHQLGNSNIILQYSDQCELKIGGNHDNGKARITLISYKELRYNTNLYKNVKESYADISVILDNL